MEPNKQLALLTAARDILAARGWTKGSWEEEDGRICAGTAIVLAHGSLVRDTAALNQLSAAKRLVEAANEVANREGRYRAVVAFNDADGTTEALVLAAFDLAIERLAAELSPAEVPPAPCETTFAEMLATYSARAKVPAMVAIGIAVGALSWLRNVGIV